MEDAVARTERHLESERLRGWDPYDGLCAPAFRLPLLRSHRLLRFGAQQAIKRAPVNLRPMLRIPKQLNPVSVGLYLQGQAQLATAGMGDFDERGVRAQDAVSRLQETASVGYAGSCWGYPFDWETRYGSIPAGTPTVVATGMVTNALARAWEVFGLESARELILSASDFVLNDLNRIDQPDGSFCWSYSPLDRQVVLNATLKGSRLLAQAHALGAGATVLEPARRSAAFVAAQQSSEGAWPYAVGDARSWADNFHTGYVLECLRSYRRDSGDVSLDPVIDRGWAYYRRSFFTSDFTPKYYDNRAGPVDATACAQSIITLCEFGDLTAAEAVTHRTIELLGRPDGSFAYQRRGSRTLRTPFLRWSSAWIYCALSRLLQERWADHSDSEPLGPGVRAPGPATKARA